METKTAPKLRKVKDLEGDEKFEGLHPNLPKPPNMILLLGAIKSSKSNCIINFLLSKDFYLGRFEKVRVLSSTLHMDNKGKLMNKHFDCDDHYDDMFIDAIVDEQGKYSKEERPTYCLVMDDILDQSFCKRNSKLAFFITKMRHYLDMTIISSQSINHVPSLIRAQSTDILVGRQNNEKEKIKIKEQYSGLLGENGDEVFDRLYKEVHSTPYNFMYIRNTTNPAEVYFNFERKIHP